MLPRWRGRDFTCPKDQVINARDSTVNLAVASEAPADAVKTAWSPWLRGQEVPLIWERVYVQPCYDV